MINTKRLIIREFDLNDAQKIYELSREDALVKFIPDQVYENAEAAQKVLKYLISQYKEKTYPLVMAVIERKSNELIGHVGLSEIDKGIEIGYAIGAANQGRGYAKETVNAYTDWGIGALKIDQIYGIADKNNIASIRVLECTGFIIDESKCNPSDDKVAYVKSRN